MAARQHKFISAFLRDGTRPEDVRQLLAKPTTYAAQSNPEHLSCRRWKQLPERFNLASRSGEAEITQ